MADRRKLDILHQAHLGLKELGLPDDQIATSLSELAAKCGVEIAAVQTWRPFGGAKSFDELDQWERGNRLRFEYDELNYQFRGMMENILADETAEGDNREATIRERIIALADEFANRADTLPEEVDQAIAVGARDDEEPGLLRRLFGGGRKETPAPRLGPTKGNFVALKEADGSWRFFTVYSNTMRDRASERFPERAHKEFVDWVYQDPDRRMPELWDWHIPVGLAAGYKDHRLGMGRVDMLHYHDGLATAAGYFYPEFYADAARLAAQENLGVSHGYEYAMKDLDPLTKDYSRYRTFEISPLPQHRAANAITLFLPEMGVKEALVNFPNEKRQHLVTVHGEAKVKAMEDALSQASGALKENGIEFKDLAEALHNDAPPAANAAPVSSVPSAAEPAGGDANPEAAMKAFKEYFAPAITAGVKEAIAPIEARLAALETGQKEAIDKAIADSMGPRFVPSPGASPSESAETVVHGGTAMVKEAKAGDASPSLEGIPEHLQFYVKNAPGFFNPVASDSIQQAIAAAGSPVS